MNLIVDQGNTATKFALFDANKIVELKKVFSRDENKEAQEWINEVVQAVKCVLISSVTNDKFELGAVKTVHLTENTPLPITNGYGTPKTLGRDRLANAVGIWSKNKQGNSLCIDMGTCIKYDLVNNNGTYLGGNISPGMQMRYKALSHFTDQLPTIIPDDFDYGYGTSTKSSIQNGVQHAIFHEINGFIQRYQEQFGELTIFMTGGDLIYFDKVFKNTIFANPILIEPDLTVFGLNEILRYNVEA